MSEDCETRQVDRRRHCEMVVALNARFTDFMERYDMEKSESAKWREKTLTKIDTLTENVSTLTRPYRLLMWVLTIVTGAFLLNAYGFVKRIILENLK